ncbi:MAG TPA: hypothetical protein VHK90_05250 [Thermoanaerobaculia bacterium]|nr:hypothetical protein [Thermoanaerobaculia bacterium]
MSRIVRPLVALLTCAFAFPAMPQCVTQMYPPNSASSIGVFAGSGWSSPPPIGSAIDMWSACSGAGSDFPAFIENGSGAINISVDYVPGRNPERGGGCARFDHDLDVQGRVEGGTIEIFESDYNGLSCADEIRYFFDNLIAHELGHVLGLGNSLCSGFIMGPDWPTVGPSGLECGWVDYAWTQPSEPPDTEGDGGGGTYEDCQSPLVLDLNGDGVHTTDVMDPVSFDLTGDGVPEQLAWTNPWTEEGFLWVDLDENGRVDNGRELFGIGTLLPNGERARDGFEALSVYDEPEARGNRDGQITVADGIWGRLRIWVDRNHDGMSQAHEIAPIHQHGVVAISLSYVIDPRPDENGNIHRLRGSYTRRVSGTLRTLAMDDVFFRVVQMP